MFTVERRNKILAYLETEGRGTVEELAKLLDVSQVTIRRDLNYLEKERYIRRTFGGAVLNEDLIVEQAYAEKEQFMKTEKERIGEAAAELMEENMAVILDAGTTAMEVAKHIPVKMPLTVITSDLQIAVYLSNNEYIKLLFVGGEVLNKTKSCVGIETYQKYQDYQADLAFIGCDAFDINNGVTTTNSQKMYLKRAMMDQATQCILLGNRLKFGKKSLLKISDLANFDVIISDKTELLMEQFSQTTLNYILV